MDAHLVDTVDGCKCSDEHGNRFIDFAADHVAAEVHAVRKVDVEGTSTPIHGLVATRAPPLEGMAGTITDADIRLGFDDSTSKPLAIGQEADERAIEKRRGQLLRWPAIEAQVAADWLAGSRQRGC